MSLLLRTNTLVSVLFHSELGATPLGDVLRPEGCAHLRLVGTQREPRPLLAAQHASRPNT